MCVIFVSFFCFCFFLLGPKIHSTTRAVFGLNSAPRVREPPVRTTIFPDIHSYVTVSYVVRFKVYRPGVFYSETPTTKRVVSTSHTHTSTRINSIYYETGMTTSTCENRRISFFFYPFF